MMIDCKHDERDPYGCVRCDDGERIRRAALEASRTAEQTPYVKCLRCGTAMNPVDAMLGSTCGTCCRELHKHATGDA